MFTLRSAPRPIAVLFAAALALVAAPVIDFWLGSPFAKLRNFIYLDGETTLQAWYSSMQWFCAAFLFGLFALHAWASRLRGFIAVMLLALACLAFSIDEIAGLHEWLGQKSDALLPQGTRRTTVLSRTGIWPILLGIPVLVVLAAIVVQLRDIYKPAPRALRLLVGGLGLMFGGALLVELGANLVDAGPEHRGAYLMQLVIEELLEMLGVTFVIWSALELLRAHGFTLRTPAAALRVEAPAPAPRTAATGRAL